MDELRANGYQIDVVYTTVTDNLDGQYWNLAAVQFPFAGKNFKQYSSEPYYIINNSETPDVDKSSDGYTWDGKFDWSQVEPGSTERVLGLQRGRSTPTAIRLLLVNAMVLESLTVSP